MDFNIRQEQIKDYEAVHKVVELAFRDMEDSDHSEPFLVDQLRQTDAFIPELSLVAEVDRRNYRPYPDDKSQNHFRKQIRHLFRVSSRFSSP